MLKEVLYALGDGSIRAQTASTEPAAEVRDHADFAADRMLCSTAAGAMQ